MKILLLIAYFILTSHLNSQPLVNSTWLYENLCKKNVKIIEVGSSYNSFLVEHIKCSQYTNFYKDGWRNNNKGIAMQMPEPIVIKNILEKMGINEFDHVILYPKKITDYYSMAETTAIYFTFKYLGHQKISILDGGYPDFKKKYTLFIEDGEFEIENFSNYNYKIDETILATTDDIIGNNQGHFQLVDARENDFYLGINKLRGFQEFGTLEKALNVPSKWLLESRSLNFNRINLIKEIFNYSEVDIEKKSIFFCYSGLESSINWFVYYELLQKKGSKLYEGSLFEWVVNGKILHKKL